MSRIIVFYALFLIPLGVVGNVAMDRITADVTARIDAVRAVLDEAMP